MNPFQRAKILRSRRALQLRRADGGAPQLPEEQRVPFHHKDILWCILIAMVARTTVLVRQRYASEFFSVDFSAMIAIILVGLGGLFVLINPRTRHTLAVTVGSSLGILFVYYLFCFVSSFWSLRPTYTAYRSVEVVALFAMASVVLSYCRDFYHAEQICLRFFLVVIILSIMMNIKFGGINLRSLHTNTYSIIAAMGSVYCYAERFFAKPVRKRMLGHYLLIFLFFLIIGTSAASNIATALGLLLVMILVGRRSAVVLFFVVVAGAALYISGSFEDALTQILLPNKDVHSIRTMTGRSHLWNVYLRLFLESPVVGHGFAVVSRLGAQFGTVSTTNAHNGFFEVLLGTGLFGAVLFVYWLARLGVEALAAQRQKVLGGIGFLAAFIVVMANNMSKSIVGGAFDPSLVVFLVFLAFFIHYIRQKVEVRGGLKKRFFSGRRRRPGSR